MKLASIHKHVKPSPSKPEAIDLKNDQKYVRHESIFPPSQVVALPIHQSRANLSRTPRVYCVGAQLCRPRRRWAVIQTVSRHFSFVKPVTAGRLLRFDPIALPNCLIRLKRKRYIGEVELVVAIGKDSTM